MYTYKNTCWTQMRGFKLVAAGMFTAENSFTVYKSRGFKVCSRTKFSISGRWMFELRLRLLCKLWERPHLLREQSGKWLLHSVKIGGRIPIIIKVSWSQLSMQSKLLKISRRITASVRHCCVLPSRCSADLLNTWRHDTKTKDRRYSVIIHLLTGAGAEKLL